MERQDWNMMCADCVVISCCCECLILQVLVFILLKLPSKLVRKTKRYMKRKLKNRMRARSAGKVIRCCSQQRLMGIRAESFRFDDEFHDCMEEVEKVLGELATKGEFGFGSFWGGDDGLEVHFPICLVNEELGYHDHDGNYHLIEVFGPFRMQ